MVIPALPCSRNSWQGFATWLKVTERHGIGRSTRHLGAVVLNVVLVPQGLARYSSHTSPPNHCMLRSGVVDVMLGSIHALVTWLGLVLVLCLMLARKVRACDATRGAVNGVQGGLNLLQGPRVP